MRGIFSLLLLISTCVAQNSRAFPGVNSQMISVPQCPNGEPPRLDRQGAPIQCLPGAGQHSVCGPVHTCFFSGMNYMCCPTNEPPADAQPVCPNGLMTVTDNRNHVVRCIPGRKACPAGGQLCLHTGREREHVCCKKFLARPSTPKPESGPLDAGHDEIVPKVSCPAKSLAVLNAAGNTIPCSATKPCPGVSHICFGTTKRAICCQEQASKHITFPKGHMIDHESGAHGVSDEAEVAHDKAIKESIKRKHVKDSGKVDKRKQFLDEVQPTMNDGEMSMKQEPTMNDGEMTMKQGPRKVKKLRRTTTTTTPSTTTTTTTTTTSASTIASPDEYEYYYVDENGNEETTTASTTTTTTTTTEAPVSRRMKKRKQKTTTTPSTDEVDEEEEHKSRIAEEIVDDRAAVLDKSFESGETLFKNRPKAEEIDDNAITEPQFARPRARAAKTLTGPTMADTIQRRSMAQKYIMRHIRNGWPYNDNYYRPDVTEAPESPSAPFVH